MKIAGNVKPISYLKTHAAKVLRSVTSGKTPLLISYRGEVKLAIQDIGEFEAMQESLALLKILAIGETSRRSGKAKPVGKTFAAVRRRVSKERK